MPDIESLADIYRRPGFIVKRLHQVATALFLEECGRYNMTPSQYQALCAIREYPGIGQSALGKLTGQDRSTVSLVVKLLFDRGLIARVVNSSDKRSASLRLSEAGVRTLREVAPATRRAQDRLLSALPAGKRAEFMALLHRLLDAHGANIETASVVADKDFGKASRSKQPEARTKR
jgi:DNA-binding MarR family transcriptional regulator